MPFNAFGETSEENLEPQVTSDDPNERKLARRLRILRRVEAAKSRQIAEAKDEEEGEEEREVGKVVSLVPKTALEMQVSTCSNNMYDTIDEGIEAVTNIQVAGNAFEVQRREEETALRNTRIKHLEEEAQIAQEKFDAINAKWEKISKLNDPLDLYQETERQKEKCKELLAMKDAVIQRLQEELKVADLRFLKDQDRQTAEINLLVQRINEQIKIMKKVLRTQLEIIEDAIDAERNELVESFNKKWEASNRQREKEQVNNLERKMVALEEHHRDIDSIMVNHQEKFRDTKISLEKDIQFLQRELESMKAVCLLNREKIDYNYQVLKKRDEENLLIKSQQKRRINKLQDIATTLRRQINEMTQNSLSEIKRLRAEVVNLYQKITDIERKSKHFLSVNEVKFNQVWKFNKERANHLLSQIMAVDRVIHEQILGLEWIQPEEYSKYLNEATKKSVEKEEEIADRRLSIIEDLKKSTTDKKSSFQESQRNLARHLLSIVADSTGFLVEDRLRELLLPYSTPQQTLVYLHNIFSALDVKNLQDIDILINILEPYTDCLTCAAKKAATSEGRNIYVTGRLSEKSSDLSMTNWKQKRNSGILSQLSGMVSEQKLMVRTVVSDLTSRHRDSYSDIHLHAEVEDESMSYETFSEEGEELHYDSDMQTLNTKILLNVKSEEELDLEENMAESEDAQKRLRHDQTEQHASIEEQKKPDLVPASREDSKKELVCARINCKNPSHALAIEPVFVLKALRDFIAEINEQEKSEVPLTLREKLALDCQAAEHKYSKEEVSNFWDGYKTMFASKQEKLWDALLLGLHKYHDILQNRHSLNMEIQRLKIQNHDLRRLLQHYTIPSYVKKVSSSTEDDLLPPIQTGERDSVSGKSEIS